MTVMTLITVFNILNKTVLHRLARLVPFPSSSHLHPTTPYQPRDALPAQNNPPEDDLKSYFPRLVLEIMHARQCSRPPSHHRQRMQRHLLDPPLQIPRLHLVIAIEEERYAADKSGVENGVYV